MEKSFAWATAYKICLSWTKPDQCVHGAKWSTVRLTLLLQAPHHQLLERASPCPAALLEPLSCLWGLVSRHANSSLPGMLLSPAGGRRSGARPAALVLEAGPGPKTNLQL